MITSLVLNFLQEVLTIHGRFPSRLANLAQNISLKKPERGFNGSTMGLFQASDERYIS
jgi:hypothetical protein